MNVPKRVIVQNTVLTLQTGCTVYLPGLAKALRVAEYNPLRFSAVTVRLTNPKSTALIFGSGKIVVTGTKSRYEALLAAYKYVNLMRERCKLRHANVYGPEVQNMVASVFVNTRLNLNKLKALSPTCSNFEPTLFPGLIWRGKPAHSMVVLVFSSGKLVITGAKVESDIAETYADILPLLAQCTIDDVAEEEPVPRCDLAEQEPYIDDIVQTLIAEGLVDNG